MHAPSDLLFRTLGDPTRRALFERLARGGDLNVRALTERSGVSQPAVSKHLNVLRRAGLVEARPAGRETRYRARPQGLGPLLGWMELYAAFWEKRFDALEDLLKRMDQGPRPQLRPPARRWSSSASCRIRPRKSGARSPPPP